MKPKKIPERQCIACNQMRHKSELMRIVKSPENEISLDVTGKKNGRGAYLCRNAECLKKAIKSKKLERAFSMQIPNEVYALLEEEMNGLEQ